MQYVRKEKGKVVETWTDEQFSTQNTSNFMLLSHDEKVALGWELVAEPVVETVVERFPTADELKQGALDYIHRSASDFIWAKYPMYKQVNALLGIYPDTYRKEMTLFINDVRTKVKAFEAQVEDGNYSVEVSF